MIFDLFHTAWMLFISGLVASILDSLVARKKVTRLLLLFFALLLIPIIIPIATGYSLNESYTPIASTFFWMTVWLFGFYKIQVKKAGKIWIVSILFIFLTVAYFLREFQVNHSAEKIILDTKEINSYKVRFVRYHFGGKAVELLKTRFNGLLEKYVDQSRMLSNVDSNCNITLIDRFDMKRFNYDWCTKIFSEK